MSAEQAPLGMVALRPHHPGSRGPLFAWHSVSCSPMRINIAFSIVLSLQRPGALPHHRTRSPLRHAASTSGALFRGTHIYVVYEYMAVVIRMTRGRRMDVR